MVGVTTALALRARGQDVALIDRSPPGCETSFGNAGIIQTEAAEPYAMPRSLRALAVIAMGRSNDVAWRAGALAANLRPLLAYFRQSAPARHLALTAIYARLIERATRDHAPLIAATETEDLIRRDGYLEIYRNARDLAAGGDMAARFARDYGVVSQMLDGDALARLEPSLQQRLPGAIHWTDPWTCRDPGALVAAYANLFLQRGGAVFNGDAMTLQRHSADWSVQADGHRINARQVVVALGPWSPQLLHRFGLHVRMLRKRGYHRHFQISDAPTLPLCDVANGTVLAPMNAGLRITTGVEIASPDAKLSSRQLTRAQMAAHTLLNLGEPVEDIPWSGTRPCLPDMLPLVGMIPGSPGLWANFGHGHQGFTLGPTTADILAEEMTTGITMIPELSPKNRPISMS